MIGIYKITNAVNGKVYVGSSVYINNRWKHHKYKLRKNKHGNQHLQRSWNKYGEDKFVFEVIEECDLSSLYIRENYWVSYYDSLNKDKGYNLDKVLPDGRKEMSKETRIKIGLAHKGKATRTGATLSEETKRAISESHKGKKLSKETRQKISNSLIGNKRTLGHKLSEEHKRKISSILAGRKREDLFGVELSEEHKEKISNGLIGNKNSLGKKLPPRSSELIKKYSDAAKKMWEKRKLLKEQV